MNRTVCLDPFPNGIGRHRQTFVLCFCKACLNFVVASAFIIGGGVAKAGDLLFEPLHRYLKAQTYGPHYEKLRILPAMFSNEAGIIGAAKMALEEAEARGKA